MRTEFEKIFYNNKTYTGIIGLSILPFLLMLTSTAGFTNNEVRINTPDTDGWQLIINSMNFAMHMFAPLIISMMAADTIASEAANGTLTLTLTKPVGRSTYLLKKILSQATLTSVIILVFALVAFLAGFILEYGTFYGVDNSGLTSTLVTIPNNEIWWRMIFFFSFAAFGSFVVALIAISISTFTNSGTTVTAVTFVIYMITEIMGGVLEAGSVKYLLSPAIKRMIWSLLYDSVKWDVIRESFIVLSIYAIAFTLISLAQFNRKDIQ